MIYIAFLFFTLLILVLAFYQWQFYMVFTPTYHRDAKLCENCSLLSVISDDGVALEGIVYEPQDIQETLLVFVGRSHDAVGVMRKLSDAYENVRIISFNYRSYGKSQGRLSEKNILTDGVKIAQLVEKNYGSFSILGYSLGTNVASYVASKHSLKNLFLVGAFDSIASLAKSKFVDKGFVPFIDLSKVFRYKLRTAEYVQSVDAPTYVFAGLDDEVTYIENARTLKNSVKNLSYYEELPDLTHKEILWDSRVIAKINEVLLVDNFR